MKLRVLRLQLPAFVRNVYYHFPAYAHFQPTIRSVGRMGVRQNSSLFVWRLSLRAAVFKDPRCPCYLHAVSWCSSVCLTPVDHLDLQLLRP